MSPDVDETAKVIDGAIKSLGDASRELDLLARKMRERNDLSYASEAVTIIASIPIQVRLDLLVTRPIRELSKTIEKMEDIQGQADKRINQSPSM